MKGLLLPPASTSSLLVSSGDVDTGHAGSSISQPGPQLTGWARCLEVDGGTASNTRCAPTKVDAPTRVNAQSTLSYSCLAFASTEAAYYMSMGL
jgi:hypothetical protein